jgi:hypothetical protein
LCFGRAQEVLDAVGLSAAHPREPTEHDGKEIGIGKRSPEAWVPKDLPDHVEVSQWAQLIVQTVEASGGVPDLAWQVPAEEPDGFVLAS